MADLALLRNSGRSVIRIRRTLKVLQVAGNASRSRQVVVSVRVALGARHLCVGTRQRKCRLRMIEGGGLPGRRRVTDLALLRYPGRHVIGIRGPLEILEVARNTCGRRDVEITIGMALIALELRVSAGQREAYRIVIEAGRLPGRGRMTILASLGKPQRHVIRVAGFLKIWQVAADASGGSSRVFAARVTSHTIQGCVHSGERESRELRVIKSDALPVVDRMAILALRRESGGNVVGRSGLLERLLMTGVALNRESLKLSYCCAFMTVRAIQARMTGHQWETVVMLPCELVDDAPAFYVMTLFTVPAHLPAMDVGMTIGAVSSHVREHRLGVTLGTGNSLMLAA